MLMTLQITLRNKMYGNPQTLDFDYRVIGVNLVLTNQYAAFRFEYYLARNENQLSVCLYILQNLKTEAYQL